MRHFNGHSHDLKLTGLVKKEEDSDELICSICEQQLSGAVYNCTKHDCEFILHKSCFELPKIIPHKSHPDHSFTLQSEPPKYSLYYNCDACGDLIRAYGFRCDECDYKMHVKCAFLPESVECKAHKHNLDLYYTASKANTPGCSFFSCDVCSGGVTEGYWTYYCKECDFATHLDCATSAEEVVEQEEEEENGDEEELPAEVQLERARIRMEEQQRILDFQMQMSRQNAAFMTSLANSWKSFLLIDNLFSCLLMSVLCFGLCQCL